jgi:hypothetical protein
MSVQEDMAGKTTNCPECWDALRVPASSGLRGRAYSAQGTNPSAPDVLDKPLPELIRLGLRQAFQQRSRYFLVGVLLLFIMLFLACGGVGALQSLWEPSEKAGPINPDAGKPVRMWEMRRNLD